MGALAPVFNPPILDRRFFCGVCTAPSNSERPPRRLSISCATEMACHRQGRSWWGDHLDASRPLRRERELMMPSPGRQRSLPQADTGSVMRPSPPQADTQTKTKCFDARVNQAFLLSKNKYLFAKQEAHVSGSQVCHKLHTFSDEESMTSHESAPACFMHWSVQRVTKHLYSVSATTNGKEYTHVGNYRSVEDANRAGRRYVSSLAHGLGSESTLTSQALA